MKKIFSLILSSVLMLSLINMPVNAENTSERILKLGDYITLGKYSGEDIVWRYVADDENGKMFFAEDVLCQKSYLKENVFVSDEGDWADSTIHLWLNSENSADMFENVYETENRIGWREYGFLSDSNFTDTEKLVIKGVKHRCKVTDGYATRGYYPSYNIPKYYYEWESEFSFSEGYSDYEFDSYHLDEYNSLPENSVVDKIFLPDVKEILAIHKNFEGYVQKETAYWLRTPELIADDMYHGKFFAVSPISTKASKLEKERGFEFITVEQGGYAGIRPAFYLNEEVAEIISGSGTLDAPFVMDGKCTEGLQLGDYISFGTFKGQDLLWRYVSDDENGKFFVTDCCLTAYSDEFKEWKDSSIRDYLRNDFLTEKNFKTEEIELVKNVTLNTASVEVGPFGHADYYPFYYTKDYDKEKFAFYSVSDEESVFLLGFGQISDIHNNYAVLGDYLRSISDNEQGREYVSYYDWEETYSYLWKLRDRARFGYGGQGGDYNIYNENIYINPERPYISHFHYTSYETDEIGIRPGFYLDESKMQILSGKGHKNEPYVIGSRVPELFEENSLYGYKDSNGKVIVTPKFLKGMEFENGAALVILPENPNELRFIKPDGTYLFDKAFSAVNNFNSGYALIVANDKGEYSYINKKGEVATELLFEKAENFDRGLARVVHNGKSGVIDTLFNFYPDEICEDYTLVKNHSGYYLTILSEGAVIYENLYETKPEIECVKDNVYKITEDITTVYIDIEKKVVSETYYYLLYADEKYTARSIDYSDIIYIADIFDKDKVFYIVDPKVGLGMYCRYLKDMKIENGVLYLKYTDYYKNNYEKEIPLTDDLKP